MQTRVQVRFGSRVRQLRLAAEMTQEDLAHRCGLFRTYMSRIETGAANPTLTMIHALASSLRVPVSSLFDDDSAPDAPKRKAAKTATASPPTPRVARKARG